MNKSKRTFITAIGAAISILFLFSLSGASPVTGTLNRVEMPNDTRQTIKDAEKEYLKIQEKDKAELKAFLAKPDKSYAIVTTPDPRDALELLKDPNMTAKQLAGSAMVPVDASTAGTGMSAQTFKRLYKVYIIMN